VQHNIHLTRGEKWGSFVEVRSNAASAYRAEFETERRWARGRRNGFKIFLSSSTEPFQPMEKRFQIARSVLEAMIEFPPDELILQTHSHHVTDCLDLYPGLSARTKLRVHISIESDRDELPGLPRSASSVSKRIEAARQLKEAGIFVVATVAPLLPIDDPETFFAGLAQVSDAVVIDHFIAGDGSCNGARTCRTALPRAMQTVLPESVTLEYRQQMAAIARRYFHERVGVNIEGFAGNWEIPWEKAR
jgi:DNA repair photolyase